MDEINSLTGIAHFEIQKAKQAVDRRIYRIEAGNFEDHRFCRDGVWELRIDVGPGYRVYFAIASSSVVLGLCAGDKSTQSMDIHRACEYWRVEKELENDADHKP